MVLLEEVIKKMKASKLSPNESYQYVLKIEQKINTDVDSLFEGLAGGQIHDILSKIGYTKNLLKLVLESKGTFDYMKALKSAIMQLEDILVLYQKSGVSTLIT